MASILEDGTGVLGPRERFGRRFLAYRTQGWGSWTGLVSGSDTFSSSKSRRLRVRDGQKRGEGVGLGKEGRVRRTGQTSEYNRGP